MAKWDHEDLKSTYNYANTVNMKEEDFGFTAVDEDDVITQNPKIVNVQARLDHVMGLISPFLENLKKDPEKKMLKWPNRAAEVAKFQGRLQEAAEGGQE